MATSSSGSDVVVVTIQRSCAKQLLVALTLALGGTPVQSITVKKGKGKGKGGGGKATSGGTGKATAGKTATSGKTASSGGKGVTATTGKTATSGGKGVTATSGKSATTGSAAPLKATVGKITSKVKKSKKK